MPFQFPDPSVSTKATLPNGEEWEYVNGAWQAVRVTDNDQAQIDALEQRVTAAEAVNLVQEEEIEQRSEEELLEEEIRNQQTLDSFVESDKNWS